MFSKKIILSFTIFCTALLNLSCSEYLRGPKKQDDILQVETKETQCLKTTPDFLNRYFEDQSNAGEISQSMACLRQALKTFTRFTTGTSPDQYTQAELQHFFNRYLLDQNKINNSFMDEIMKMKVLAVGGSQRSFTRLELEQFSQYLVTLESQMLRLNGHWQKILFKSSDKKVTLEQITETTKILKDVVSTLVFESKVTSSGYEFADLQSFFSEINRFLSANDSRLDALIKWLPLMKSVKVTFLGEYLKVSTRSEWKEQIDWAIDSYSLAMNFFYIAKDQDMKSPDSWDSTIAMVDQGMDLVQRSPVFKAQGLLSSRNLDHLLDDLFLMEIFKPQISSDIVKNTYKKVLFHWFEEKKGDALNEVRGFEEKHLAILRAEYELWKQAQVGIIRAFRLKSEYSTSEFLNFSRKQGPPLIMNLEKANLRKDQLAASWAEWLEILGRPRVPVMNSDLKLTISYEAASAKQNFLGLTVSNALRMIVRLWMKGYGDHVDRALFHTGMPLQGIINLEYDFREFGRAVGFLDPRSPNAAARTFKEANFFTFSGNGDERMDAYETYELLHFMVSAGFLIADEIDTTMQTKSNCNVVNLDRNGKKKSKIECFEQIFSENYAQFFNASPSMLRFLGSIREKDPQKFKEVFNNLIKIAREDNPEEGLIEYSELRTFSSLIQYVESLFVQYDSDASQALSFLELRSAEPRFHAFIKGVSIIKTDSFVREVFLFLVMEGKTPPQKWNEVDVRLLSSYSWNRVYRNTQTADRAKLFNVLGVLKNAP